MKTIKELHRKNQMQGIACPELVIIEATEKKAASTYNLEDEEAVDLDFMNYADCDMSDIEWDNIE